MTQLRRDHLMQSLYTATPEDKVLGGNAATQVKPDSRTLIRTLLSGWVQGRLANRVSSTLTQQVSCHAIHSHKTNRQDQTKAWSLWPHSQV